MNHELLLMPRRPKSKRPCRDKTPAVSNGCAVGRIVDLTESGEPMVEMPGHAFGPTTALSVVPVGLADIGRDAVVTFDSANAGKPIILGLLVTPAPALAVARVDGERIELRADREIELSCGKASIILTRAGKVLIRGTYVLSRSSGANRIKGGSVQIN